jgi:outer membrane protein OmpA-like peptidoglycan-associated protein/subtilisin family serine protease
MMAAIRTFIAVLVGLMCTAITPSNVAAQGQVKDLNQIIRSLAPLEYLPEHSGRPALPSIDLDIRFAVDQATLLPEAVAQLRELGRALRSPRLRNKTIEVAGHTDATGSQAHNKALSVRRAEAVADYLTQEFKINPGRLAVVGHGEERLKDPLLPAGGVNRRVEITATGSVAAAMSAATVSAAGAVETVSANASGTWGNLLKNASGAQALLRRAEARGTARVIVGLAAPGQDVAQQQGWQNLNDYIRDLQDNAIAKLGWTNINDLVRFDYTPAMAMTVDASRLRGLLTGDAVTQVFEDHLMAPSLQQSVPLIGMRPPRAETQAGAGQAVAVLDTGVDFQHPFLKGRAAAEACFSTNARQRDVVLRSACPSGEESEIGPGAGRPCDPAFDCDHGTRVAGIIAGYGKEMSGVAPEASIVSVQVFTLVEAPTCGKCSLAFTSDVLRGLEWVYRNRERYKIAAVNLSLGGGRFRQVCDSGSPYTRLFELLTRAGVAPVVASGNDGLSDAVANPACVSDAVSVGATSFGDKVAEFSNSADFLDFLAPGATEQTVGKSKGVLSSVPGKGYHRTQGTSMAAPHVAGAIAVLKSAVPEASLGQMLRALRQTGRRVVDQRNGIAVPRIQLDAAIKYLLADVARAPSKPVPKTEPKPAPKVKVYDGIRVYGDKEKDDKRIKW